MSPSSPTVAGLDPVSAAALLQEAREQSPEALYATAVRTRSRLAVRLAAHLASPDRDPAGLLALASEPESAALDGIDPPYLAAYAAALARRRQYDDAYPLFGLVERLSPGSISPEYQIRYAEAALAVTGSAAAVLGRFDGMHQRWKHAFEADQAHPERGGDPETWLQRFRTFTGMDDLKLAEGDGPMFDRLAGAPADPVLSSRRISVIMSCFRPDETLFTAVQSVLAQSWQNWELLIVDDASGPEYADLLARAAALDERIRIFRLPVNSGTYRARNRALLECKGAFVTGLDSDDWAHPRWLERQVDPLLNDAGLVMTFSNCIRVRENLTAIHTGRPVQGPRSTSIMFRAAPVRERMGYFDSLRKGADTEFHFRFKAVFGNRAVRKIQDEIFTLVRLSGDTLTSREIDNGWQHPARSAYQSAHLHWRERIRRGHSDGFIEADQPHREFFAPGLNRGVRLDGRHFDELYVLDCRFWESGQERALDLARESAAAGRAVGVVHLESLLRLREDQRPLRPEILDRLNETGIEFVGAVDPVTVERLIVTDPSLWEEREDEFAFTGVGDVEIWDPTIEPTSRKRGNRAPAKASAAPAPAPRRTGAFRRRRLVAAAFAVLAAVCAFAAASWFWAPTGIAAASTFSAVSALMGVGIVAFTAAGFGRFRYVVGRVLRR
jgi:glycosyltransferase involved in cell wall biosynthesis